MDVKGQTMRYARYLILLMLFSAVASPVTGVSVADGYQSTTDISHALVSAQEHEGDQPDAVLSTQADGRRILRDFCIGEPQHKAVLNAYSDYHCRAPPQLL
ncbi:hypothetical protein CWE09_04410 [Aliidiomarina minuta]|uniref:UrcA family protein n=2 Tax=Aliidiomarina minuta TaxID=880057 RepID=A0A432W7P9_9GAMM|nr:hypothetical protein CWE09_04410 [Aliidiomarina minuta]